MTTSVGHLRSRAITSRAIIVLCLVGLSGCVSEPSSCEEAECDPAIEFCLLFGSDTLEPSSASCRPFPDACAEAATCECLLEDQDAIATCEEDNGAFSVVVPGG